MKDFCFGQDKLDFQILAALGAKPVKSVRIAGETWERLDRYRQVVDNIVASSQTVYGINTGFGFLSDVKIDSPRLAELQENLIRSHACGVGEGISLIAARGLLALRLHTLLLGASGVSRETITVLSECLQRDVIPWIPAQGSVGASGDLAPLAHLALALMGEGRVHYRGSVVPAAQALEAEGIARLVPKAKEGLALINGTQFMTALSAEALALAWNLARTADLAAALSLDALRGTRVAFDPRIQALRPHPGQTLVARNITALVADDPIMASHANCGRVQDPYSFRCVPQVHGATRDVLQFVSERVNCELNSVTDNPLVFNEGEILSGGNFHGQPVAFAMDFLAIAINELGSISERRIDKLINPQLSGGQPAFLSKLSGLNSGYMIPQVVAAALVSENKVLCHPASIDSIPTSADKEDHVSMGPIAARKAMSVLGNVGKILAIEVLAACQGLDLLLPLRPSAALAAVYERVRAVSPFMDRDRSLHEDINAVESLVRSGDLVATAEAQGVGVS